MPQSGLSRGFAGPTLQVWSKQSNSVPTWIRTRNRAIELPVGFPITTILSCCQQAIAQAEPLNGPALSNGGGPGYMEIRK